MLWREVFTTMSNFLNTKRLKAQSDQRENQPSIKDLMSQLDLKKKLMRINL